MSTDILVQPLFLAPEWDDRTRVRGLDRSGDAPRLDESIQYYTIRHPWSTASSTVSTQRLHSSSPLRQPSHCEFVTSPPYGTLPFPSSSHWRDPRLISHGRALPHLATVSHANIVTLFFHWILLFPMQHFPLGATLASSSFPPFGAHHTHSPSIGSELSVTIGNSMTFIVTARSPDEL